MTAKKSSVLLKIAKVIFFIYVGLFSTIWLASSPVATYFIKQALQPMGLVLSETSTIRYNPFTSHLEVKSLALTTAEKPDTQVLKLDSLDIEVRLYALLFKQLYISEFALDGFYLLTDIEDELVTVSGIALPKQQGEPEQESADVLENNTKKQSPSGEVGSEAPTASPIDDYLVLLPKLKISNSIFELAIADTKQQFNLEQLIISALQASTTSQRLTLVMDSKINQASLRLDSEISLQQGLGTLATKVKLSALSLQHFASLAPETITNLQGELSYQAQHLVEITDNKILLTNENIDTVLADFALSINDKNISVAQQVVNSDLIKVALSKNEAQQTASLPIVKGDIRVQVQKASVFAQPKMQPGLQLNLQQDTQQDRQNQLANLRQQIVGLSLFDTGRIDIDTNDDIGYFARWQQLLLQDAFFSDDIDNDIPALAKFKALTINQGQASAQGVSIDHISLAGFNVNAHINPDKVLVNLVDLGADTSAPTPDNSDDDEEQVQTQQSLAPSVHEQAGDPAPFYLVLKRFHLADPAQITFLDESVQPNFKQDVLLTTLTAGPFDTRSPDNDSYYQLIGTSNKYTKLEFAGEMKPFAELPFYSINGSFNEFELPPVSSYIKDALGYEIQSGQLDLALDAQLTGNIIDGDSTILLRGIDLKAADAHEQGNIADSTAVPFNVALGMLKDSNGNVELDFPFDGDINSPQFGVSGFLTLIIKKATMMAAKDYLMTTFVPYANVVSIAMAAGQYALKVRINDLNYGAGQADLNEEQQVFLAEFATLLKEKPELQVKLCPVATPEDIDLPLTQALTNENDVDLLRMLSNKRVELFKSQLVEQYNVESGRLLSCTPQISIADDAKPHISFKI